MAIQLQTLGDQLVSKIKNSSWFPYKTGKLKFHATRGSLVSPKTYRIQFDASVAPYIEYLEEGTGPHNIPGAFGRPMPFGIGGRFNGKFHPGSTKHKGFISNNCVKTIVDYISIRYKGVVEVK